MKAGQHTPGPWEVVRHAHIDGELWLSVNQHADARGMKEWIAEIKYLTTEAERQWANARLIAAAPDLLEALKDCCAALGGTVAHPEAIPASALIAIAKAEGR